MINKSIVLGISVVVAVGGILASPQPSSEPSSSKDLWTNPVGTFDLTVTAPGQPPFQELLTLHAGGTVSETNTTLHPNSAVPAVFPFNGSDGYGAWQRHSFNKFKIRIVKIVFDEDNQHLGYLVVDALARIRGDNYENIESDVNIRVGPDLKHPISIIPLGPTEAVGSRIRVGD